MESLTLNGNDVALTSGDARLSAIDTGTTLIGGPTDDVQAFWEGVDGSNPIESMQGFWSFRTYIRPTSIASPDRAPSVRY